jgi:CheY-like chemotaxis protein
MDCSDRPGASPAPHVSEPAMHTNRPLHVLVVDDEPDIVESTITLLDLHGFRPAGATGGEEALRLAADDPPDVALIDLGMPGVDGFEAARRLGELARPPFLIAVTGRPMNWDRGRAFAAGFQIYLTKPVPPGELVDLLRQCEHAHAEKV